MNLLRIISIIFLILFFLSTCVSTQNYFINRGNDLKDIVHIGLEKDVYGASIFVDSYGLGIQHAANGKGFGMRYGTAGLYLGIRLGFNFSELADFLVGFIGFDPLGDDIAGILQPISLDKNWEDQMDNLDEIIRPIPVIEKSKFF